MKGGSSYRPVLEHKGGKPEQIRDFIQPSSWSTELNREEDL